VFTNCAKETSSAHSGSSKATTSKSILRTLQYYGLLQIVVLYGILRFITNGCVGRNITVYYKWLCWTEYYGLLQMVVLDGTLRFITNSCDGRNITVYYKWLCWTEYYGLLQMVVLDGILRFITNGCVGWNDTVYYKWLCCTEYYGLLKLLQVVVLRRPVMQTHKDNRIGNQENQISVNLFRYSNSLSPLDVVSFVIQWN